MDYNLLGFTPKLTPVDSNEGCTNISSLLDMEHVVSTYCYILC